MKPKLAMLAVVAVLSGCGAGGTSGESVSENENGELISLERGDRLTVSLREKPSTGYLWRIVQAPRNDVLELTSRAYRSDFPGDDPPGGIRIYRFRTTGEGRTPLAIELFPPGRKARATKRYALQVDVTDER